MPEEKEQRADRPRLLDRIRAGKLGARKIRAFERILVAVDFSVASKRAAATADSLIEANGSLYALHVLPDILSETEDYLKDPAIKDFQRRMTREAEKKLNRWMEKNVEASCKIECAVAVGDAATEIIKAARAKGVQLIALGVHGQKRSDLGVIGSVADKVVRLSDCPVICVPTERI